MGESDKKPKPPAFVPPSYGFNHFHFCPPTDIDNWGKDPKKELPPPPTDPTMKVKKAAKVRPGMFAMLKGGGIKSAILKALPVMMVGLNAWAAQGSDLKKFILW